MKRFKSIVESTDTTGSFSQAKKQLSTITETDETFESDKERGGEEEEEATDGVNLYFSNKQRSASPLGTSKG